jgi:hypothetical protein
MYADKDRQFAVWYEPVPGDTFTEGLSQVYAVAGMTYFLLAPRISDWEEFKKAIKEFETGQRRPSPDEAKKAADEAAKLREIGKVLMDMRNRGNRGCLVSILLFLMVAGGCLAVFALDVI